MPQSKISALAAPLLFGPITQVDGSIVVEQVDHDRNHFAREFPRYLAVQERQFLEIINVCAELKPAIKQRLPDLVDKFLQLGIGAITRTHFDDYVPTRLRPSVA